MSSKKRSKKSKKSKKIILILLILLVVLVIICIPINFKIENNTLKNNYKTMYISSDTNTVKLYKLVSTEETKSLEEEKEITRGIEVLDTNKQVSYEDNLYTNIIIDDEKYYISTDNLTKNKEDVVKEEYIYTRSATSILESNNDIKISGLTKKGEKLEVIGYDYLDTNGNVNLYKVKVNEIEGYVYSKYMSLNEEEAKKNYNAANYDPIHSKVKNLYNGGEAIKLDFYPNEKLSFENNIMPDSVYALYLNCGKNTIDNIDSYIEFAKTTKINAFVVDIKDNTTPAYSAKTFETLSPTNYSKAINTYDSYKNAITKLKEAGFYVIGRITVFKDSYYVTDHKEDAIMNKNTSSPYLHNGSYWPSAYDRDVWYFNVSLAKEAVEEFGFNEINFDYVRFPDRMNSVSDIVDLNNTYNEDKVEAIQRFVQ